MKKLIGWTGSLEKKMTTFENICEAEDANALQDLLGVDVNEATVADMLISAMSYVTGIPESLWHKKLSELTMEDAKLMIEADSQIVEFCRV